jgi:homoserine O-acetyltransferase
VSRALSNEIVNEATGGGRRRQAGRMTVKALGAVLLALCAAGPARADKQIFNLYDFAFESGQIVSELHIAYESRGRLNARRDNAIVLIGGEGGAAPAYQIGPGRTFDTDKYYVVSVDPLGCGASSSPQDGAGQDFPRYTIRDLMAALQVLTTRGLELTGVRAVAGIATGADIALEWGIRHPEVVRGLILLAPSPKTSPQLQLTIDLMTSVIALDPEWQGGRYAHNPVEGLRLAGMQYYPWSVSAAYLDRITAKRRAAEIEASARLFGERDANSLVLRLAAARAHDVSAPFGGNMSAALTQVAAPALILVGASDRLVGLDGARRLRDGLRQPSYAEIPSDLGHRALVAGPETPEGEFIDRQIRSFLAKAE